MATAIHIEGQNSKQITEEVAKIIYKIFASNKTEEEKDKAYKVINDVNSIHISDCTIHTAADRLTLWQYLGITK